MLVVMLMSVGERHGVKLKMVHVDFCAHMMAEMLKKEAMQTWEKRLLLLFYHREALAAEQPQFGGE